MTIRSATASLLLHRLPERERAQVVRDVAGQLNAQSTKDEMSLALALLRLQPDPVAWNAVVDRVAALVQNGEHQLAASLCSEDARLGDEVLEEMCERISRLAASTQQDGAACLAVASGDPGSRVVVAKGLEEWSDRRSVEDGVHLVQCLAFVNRSASAGLDDEAVASLLESCLVLVGAQDRQLSGQAAEVLHSLLKLTPAACRPHQHRLWTRILELELVRGKPVGYGTMGCSLWLRWISTGQGVALEILQSEGYWRALADGLRRGDSEGRKSWLQILRASVEMCAAAPSIAASEQTAEAVPSLRTQYLRFCTLFETIVLGRYLNQLHQCEPDLDFLASARSAVKPAFLFALLEAALSPSMQDANRKCIGAWCLRSDMRTDDIAGFTAFLRHTLLPWATRGHLFTSTLTEVDGIFRSEHGERLAAYLATALRKHRHLADRLVAAIASSILARHPNTFAYATVYLVEGIGRALDQDTTLDIGSQHLEGYHAAAAWIGFPEVARDHILARTWKMCWIRYHADGAAVSSPFLEKAASDWEMLKARAQSLGPGASVQSDGSISSLSLSPSKRDIREAEARQKCTDLLKSLGDLNSPAIQTQLEDIWSDLEYLEYPKGLLSTLPKVLLHQAVISRASQHMSSLADCVARMASDLLRLAISRSYLLPTLLEALRAAILADPKTASFLHLDELIFQVAHNPPTATVDAKLEAAAIPLLQGIAPELEKFNYGYYFGESEGYGVAVLLDVVARLKTVDSELPLALYNRLLGPFLKQKIPPPMVSAWKKVLQLQVMLLCAEQYVPDLSLEEARAVLRDLHYILAIESMPRYRYLMEWMIARMYTQHPDLRPMILEELRTKDHHSNPKFLASLMKIGVNIAKTDGSDEDFALQLATVFVPLAASSKVVIRHEAQWQFPILLDFARAKDWKPISQSSIFEALDDFIRSLERYSDPPLERVIDRFDPIQDHNLTHLVEGAWHGLDAVERRQTSRNHFVAIHRRDTSTANLPSSCMPLGDVRSTKTCPLPTSIPTPTRLDHEKHMLQDTDHVSRSLGHSAADPWAASGALQTKGAAYLSSSETRHRHPHLLVVASLVDNPYNLGGLSRVSEIFGAGSLYLPTPPAQATANKDFQGVSVSSHLHLPLRHLPAKGLEDWLRARKRDDGYQVVGIEQTDRSVLLGADGCVLPDRCILVMGSEKEGIPAAVLAECGVLVEIPQVGITRSLNVQTAAAIVLCEYARQQRSRRRSTKQDGTRSPAG